MGKAQKHDSELEHMRDPRRGDETFCETRTVVVERDAFNLLAYSKLWQLPQDVVGAAKPRGMYMARKLRLEIGR